MKPKISKAIEKALLGKVKSVPDVLISKLLTAGVCIQLQLSDEDNRQMEPLLVLWGLSPSLCGRTMDNNEGREERYSSNAYFYKVPDELVPELALITRTKKHKLYSDGWRVAGLSTCLGVIYKCRNFIVKPIASKTSRRRRLLPTAIRAAAEVLPMFTNRLEVALDYYKVKLSSERRFPAGH